MCSDLVGCFLKSRIVILSKRTGFFSQGKRDGQSHGKYYTTEFEVADKKQSKNRRSGIHTSIEFKKGKLNKNRNIVVTHLNWCS